MSEMWRLPEVPEDEEEREDVASHYRTMALQTLSLGRKNPEGTTPGGCTIPLDSLWSAVKRGFRVPPRVPELRSVLRGSRRLRAAQIVLLGQHHRCSLCSTSPPRTLL